MGWSPGQNLFSYLETIAEERTERIEARQETRQTRAEEGVSGGKLLADRFAAGQETRNMILSGVGNFIAENPEALTAGITAATGGVGAGLTALLSGLSGGEGQTDTPAATSSPSPLILPAAILGGALLISRRR